MVATGGGRGPTGGAAWVCGEDSDCRTAVNSWNNRRLRCSHSAGNKTTVSQSCPIFYHVRGFGVMNMINAQEKTPWKCSIAFFIFYKASSLNNWGLRGQMSKAVLRGLSCSKLSCMSLLQMPVLWPGGSRWVTHTIQCPLSTDVTQVLFPEWAVITCRWWHSSALKSLGSSDSATSWIRTFSRQYSAFLSVLVTKEITGFNWQRTCPATFSFISGLVLHM